MKIAFDPTKDAANRIKHGVSLARAVDVDFATAVVRSDERHDYGEPRWRAYGTIDGRAYEAFMIRDGMLRPISLRKANAKEKSRYGGPESQP